MAWPKEAVFFVRVAGWRRVAFVCSFAGTFLSEPCCEGKVDRTGRRRFSRCRPQIHFPSSRKSCFALLAARWEGFFETNWLMHSLAFSFLLVSLYAMAN